LALPRFGAAVNGAPRWRPAACGLRRQKDGATAGMPLVLSSGWRSPFFSHAPGDPPVPSLNAVDDTLFEALIATTVAAGAVVMQVYDGAFAVEHKGDASPVTEADRLAEAVILADLARLVAAVPVVAEEACS